MSKFDWTTPESWQYMSAISVGDDDDSRCWPDYQIDFVDGINETYLNSGFGQVQLRLNKLALYSVQQSNK